MCVETQGYFLSPPKPNLGVLLSQLCLHSLYFRKLWHFRSLLAGKGLPLPALTQFLELAGCLPGSVPFICKSTNSKALFPNLFLLSNSPTQSHYFPCPKSLQGQLLDNGDHWDGPEPTRNYLNYPTLNLLKGSSSA